MSNLTQQQPEEVEVFDIKLKPDDVTTTIMSVQPMVGHSSKASCNSPLPVQYTDKDHQSTTITRVIRGFKARKQAM